METGMHVNDQQGRRATFILAPMLRQNEKPVAAEGYPVTLPHLREHVWGVGLLLFARTPPSGEKWHEGADEWGTDVWSGVGYRLLWWVDKETDDLTWNDEIINLATGAEEPPQFEIDTVPA